MVKDHSDSEKGNPLSTYRLLLLINSKGYFMEHWLEREIAQCVHPMKDRSDDPSHHERTLYPGVSMHLTLTNIPAFECAVMNSIGA